MSVWKQLLLAIGLRRTAVPPPPTAAENARSDLERRLSQALRMVATETDPLLKGRLQEMINRLEAELRQFGQDPE